MANKKISELAAAVALGATDLFEVVQAGVNVKMTGAQLLAAMQAAIPAAGTPINVQTGTSYALALTDAGKAVEMNNAAANTVTVPPNSSVAFVVGESILVRQMGAGQTTLVAGSGVTIRNPHGTLKLTKQYAAVSLHKRGTDEWCVEGNLAEA